MKIVRSKLNKLNKYLTRIASILSCSILGIILCIPITESLRAQDRIDISLQDSQQKELFDVEQKVQTSRKQNPDNQTMGNGLQLLFDRKLQEGFKSFIVADLDDVFISGSDLTYSVQTTGTAVTASIVNGTNQLQLAAGSGSNGATSTVTIKASDGANSDQVTFTVTLIPSASSPDIESQSIISTAAIGAKSVYAADMDGDGDLDALSASGGNNTIAWYENDGAGGEWTIHKISTSALNAWSVYAADMDWDGDLDVLSASQDDNTIAWYENDGTGGGWTTHEISTNVGAAMDVYAADMDGDGDLDILSASLNDAIAWYENDGTGGGWTTHEISTNVGAAMDVYAADMDGDGDLDVLSASLDDGIAWHENDGTGGGWTTHEISKYGGVVITKDNLRGGRTTYEISTVHFPTSVYAADMDGDGDLDALSASSGNNTIAWHENDGVGGEWTFHKISTNAVDARSVYAKDMDGDGDLDVLSASQDDNKIAWYENYGFGIWTFHEISTNAISAQDVYAADMDGDGDFDVLSASWVDHKIAWYENDSGGWTTHEISTDANFATSVYTADMDGDGDLDVLSASFGDDKIAWYENMLVGGPPTAPKGLEATAGEQQVTLNWAANSESDISKYTIYRGTTTGNLNSIGEKLASDINPTTYKDQGLTAGITYFYAITVTNDSGAESDLSNEVSATPTEVINMDILTAPQVLFDRNLQEGFKTFEVADLDDVFISGSDLTYSVQTTGTAVTASIVNGTNQLQLAAGSGSSGAGAIINVEASNGVNSGQVTFTVTLIPSASSPDIESQSIISTAAIGAKSVYAADMDGDGDLDGLSASSDDDLIAWYENDGTGGGWTTHEISTAANGAFSVYAADMDGDGDLDILSASRFDDAVAWYENDGTGRGWTTHEISTGAIGVVSVYAADMDGDGDLDALSASVSNNTIAWYENDGTGGGWTTHEISTGADGAVSVYAADVDGDGDLDALSASSDDNTIAWYENDGTGGGWTTHEISITAVGAVSVYAADIDGDRDLDVLSASQDDNKIAWYENDGTEGGWTTHKISTGAVLAQDVYAADVDGDGDFDVLSASSDDNTIAWYENDGTGGGWTTHEISTGADGAVSVYAVDMDGDGDLDVLSASQNDNTIAWYKNTLEGGGQPTTILSEDLSVTDTVIYYQSGLFIVFQQNIVESSLVDNITLSGSKSGDVTISNSEVSNGNEVIIAPQNIFTPAETLTLTFNADTTNGIRSESGAYLDGDGDLILEGSPEDDLRITYHVAHVSDLNVDGLTNLNDLYQLRDVWSAQDTERNIGPVSGMFPYVTPVQDNVIDFEDLMVYVQDWNWIVDNQSEKQVSPPPSSVSQATGTDMLSMQSVPDGATLQLYPIDDLTAFEIRIDLSQSNTTLSEMSFYESDLFKTKELDNKHIILQHFDEASQVMTVQVVFFEHVSFEHKITLGQFTTPSAEVITNIKTSATQLDSFGKATESAQTHNLEMPEEIPTETQLLGNYPNPFNPSTVIRYELSKDAQVTLDVFDMLGRKVTTIINTQQSAGAHESVWNSDGRLGSGIYFYRLHVQHGGGTSYQAIQKMLLLK